MPLSNATAACGSICLEAGVDGADDRAGECIPNASNGARRSMNALTLLRTAASLGTGKRTVSWACGAPAHYTPASNAPRDTWVAVKISAVSAQATLDAQQAMFTAMPAHAARSVTADNGSEFAYHHQLADSLAIPTYFADPYSAYQRGTNEHFNGRIRKYLPKGTSFKDLDQAELDDYITEINNRPRKVLGWATPAEVFAELSSTHTTTTRCTSN